MDLSIIVVNWNTKALLDQCLAALPLACGSLEYEVFVVDNGSSDGSQAMMRETFAECTLIENDENRGFAGANNQALRKAKGRYYLLLNSDTKAKAETFAKMIAYLDEHEDIGIAGPQLLNEDSSKQHSIAVAPGLMIELGKKSLLRKLWPEKFYGKKYQPAEATDVDTVIGASLLIRASTVEQIGLLDEDYFFFIEETDWCVRTRQVGQRVVFLPQFEVFHFQGKTAEQVPVPVRIEYWRSRYTYFKKHRSMIARLVLFIGLAVHLFVDIIFFTICSLWKAKARGRLKICMRILFWHLLFCPSDWGLKPKAGG